MKSVTVNANDAEQRVDKFLHKYFKSRMPTSMIYKSIRKKRVKVNGKRTDIGYILKQGDVLDLYINDEFFSEKADIRHIKRDFGIVYEDENILLLDKKAGTVVHDDDRGSVNTLIAQLHSYLIEKGEYSPEQENSFAPALCNRIDRNTSGLVIAAKNAPALKAMNDILKHRMVKKWYLALVSGKLEQKQGTLEGYLFKDSKTNRVYVTKAPQKGASKIITAYSVVRYCGNDTLVEVELITGRTHQIRAHFASIGHPLVGDGKYGKLDNPYGFKHQALHSYKMTFQDGFSDTCLAYLEGCSFQSQMKCFADFL